MIKELVIKILTFILQIGKLSILLLILFCLLFLFKGVNIFEKIDRFLIVIGTQIFIVFSCYFILKKLN